MKKMYFYRFKNCNLLHYTIVEDDGAICNVFPKSLLTAPIQRIDCSCFAVQNEFIEKETPLIKRAAKQLDEYFSKKRKFFELPLRPEGTEFQLKVWKALQNIPCGETRTYGDIAAAIGNPKASRAVGMANNKNPIHIVIPCHRVIGANGSLVGYAGGLEIKKLLLELESKVFL